MLHALVFYALVEKKCCMKCMKPSSSPGVTVLFDSAVQRHPLTTKEADSFRTEQACSSPAHHLPLTPDVNEYVCFSSCLLTDVFVCTL